MSGRLILYDTSNYEDYPVGGQMTSIRNFLRYMAEEHAEHAGDILLVGVSRAAEEIGRPGTVTIEGVSFPFLPVTQAPADLSQVKHSLRKDFLLGILRYRRGIRPRGGDCNYIHTPEAFAAVRLIHPGAVCYVFSHGTFFNMWQRVRFFKKMPFVRKAFQRYLMQVIRKSRKVFVLDRQCQRDYEPYNANVVLARNTIICRAYRERTLGSPIRFLFAGRLSGEKNIGPIIEAVKTYHRDATLTLLGEGEEHDALKELAGDSPRIVFRGAVAPAQVQEEMDRHDILVMNSVSEGMPMVILEALSSGLPIITTNVGGIPDVLDYGIDAEMTDGRPGQVANGTAEQIQEAADRIVPEYARYARAAYEKSLTYDYRKGNRSIYEELNEVLQWQ